MEVSVRLIMGIVVATVAVLILGVVIESHTADLANFITESLAFGGG